MGRETISILGCGWLGLPLGRKLADEGWHVQGSTTRPEKQDVLHEVGIEPFLIQLAPEARGDRIGAFFDADLLFLNVPPSRKREDVETYHRRQIEAVVSAVETSRITWVIFASSTSVYPAANDVVTEEDAGQPERATGRVLLEVESMLQSNASFDTTILRFAGLYGYDRQPGRFLAGRTGVTNGGAPVNLVHRDDAIGVVEAVIQSDARDEVFNVCAEEHPSRQDFYVQEARKLGLEPPDFADGEARSYKVVSSDRVRQKLGYRFQHPNPMDEAP